MKAEEILTKHTGDVLNGDLKNDVIQAMKEYAERSCEVQREICTQKYVDMPKDSPLVATSIMIAPEPDFE